MLQNGKIKWIRSIFPCLYQGEVGPLSKHGGIYSYHNNTSLTRLEITMQLRHNIFLDSCHLMIIFIIMCAKKHMTNNSKGFKQSRLGSILVHSRTFVSYFLKC